jgi:hypothetical protein
MGLLIHMMTLVSMKYNLGITRYYAWLKKLHEPYRPPFADELDKLHEERLQKRLAEFPILAEMYRRTDGFRNP